MINLKLISAQLTNKIESEWYIPPGHMALALSKLPCNDEPSPSSVSAEALIARLEAAGNTVDNDREFTQQFKAAIVRFRKANSETEYFNNATYLEKYNYFLRLVERELAKRTPESLATVKSGLSRFPISTNFMCKGGGMTDIEKGIRLFKPDYYQDTLSDRIDDFVGRRRLGLYISHRIYETHIPKGLRILMGGDKEAILRQDESHSLGMIQDLPCSCPLELYRELQSAFMGEFKHWLPRPDQVLSEDGLNRFREKEILPRDVATDLFRPDQITEESLALALQESDSFKSYEDVFVAQDLSSQEQLQLFQELANRLLSYKNCPLVRTHHTLLLNPDYDWFSPIGDQTLHTRGGGITISEKDINSFLYGLSSSADKKLYRPVANFDTAIAQALVSCTLGFQKRTSVPRILKFNHRHELCGKDGEQHVDDMVKVLEALHDEKEVHPDDITTTLITLRSEIEPLQGSSPLIPYAVILKLGVKKLEKLASHSDLFVAQHAEHIFKRYTQVMHSLFDQYQPSLGFFLERGGSSDSDLFQVLYTLLENNAPIWMVLKWQKLAEEKGQNYDDCRLAEVLHEVRIGTDFNNDTYTETNWGLLEFMYEHSTAARAALQKKTTPEDALTKQHHDPKGYDQGLTRLILLDCKRTTPHGASLPEEAYDTLRGFNPFCKTFIKTFLSPQESPETAFPIGDIMTYLEKNKTAPHPHLFFILMTVLSNYPEEETRPALCKIAELIINLPMFDQYTEVGPAYLTVTMKHILNHSSVTGHLKEQLREQLFRVLLHPRKTMSRVATPEIIRAVGKEQFQALLTRHKEELFSTGGNHLIQHLLRPEIAMEIGKTFLKKLLLPHSSYDAIPVAQEVNPETARLLFSENMMKLLGESTYDQLLFGENYNQEDGTGPSAAGCRQPSPNANLHKVLSRCPKKDRAMILFDPNFVRALGPERYIKFIAVDHGALFFDALAENIALFQQGAFHPHHSDLLTPDYFIALGEYCDDLFEIRDNFEQQLHTYRYSQGTSPGQHLADPGLWEFIPEKYCFDFFTEEQLVHFLTSDAPHISKKHERLISELVRARYPDTIIHNALATALQQRQSTRSSLDHLVRSQLVDLITEWRRQQDLNPSEKMGT